MESDEWERQMRSSVNHNHRRSMLRLIVAGVFLVFLVSAVLTWRGTGFNDGEDEVTTEPAPRTENGEGTETSGRKSSGSAAALLQQDPFAFLMSFVPGAKLLVCATEAATVPTSGETHRYRVSDRKDNCDVFVTKGGTDVSVARVSCVCLSSPFSPAGAL